MLISQCAAHLCYACACDSSFDSTKQRGGDDRKFDGQGGGVTDMGEKMTEEEVMMEGEVMEEVTAAAAVESY